MPPVLDEFSKRVQSLVAELPALESTLATDAGVAMHRVAAYIAALVSAIAAAESAGIRRSLLDELLAPLHAALSKCAFYHRTHSWPRGYPGDFETVEMICHPQKFVTARQSFADWAQELTLNHPTTQQHRNKVVRQALSILEAAHSATSETRILSAGCGGCPDLRMLLPLLGAYPGKMVLVDSDAEALAFSRRMLGDFAPACEFVEANALRYLKQAVREGQRFDLILAGGLFDYFSDEKVAFFVSTAYHELLKRGGRLVFTNVGESPHQVMIDYFARWKLIVRSEDALLALCRQARIEDGAISLEREATGITVIVEVRRGAHRCFLTRGHSCTSALAEASATSRKTRRSFTADASSETVARAAQAALACAKVALAPNPPLPSRRGSHLASMPLDASSFALCIWEPGVDEEHLGRVLRQIERVAEYGQ